MAGDTVRQITLRVPAPLYDQVSRLAKQRKVSINRLAQESLQALTQDALAEEMRAAYESLAAEAEEVDAEAFHAAQREVVCGEPV